MSLRKLLIVLGLMVVGAVVLAACGGTATTSAPAGTAAPTAPTLNVPFKDTFLASGHANATDEPFTHWDKDGAVPTTCARCHTSAGFQEFAATGKIAADVKAPAGAFNCDTCHNAAAMALTSVTFPSGKVVETSEEGEARCMTCHQGRESKVSVDKQISKSDRSHVVL